MTLTYGLYKAYVKLIRPIYDWYVIYTHFKKGILLIPAGILYDSFLNDNYYLKSEGIKIFRTFDEIFNDFFSNSKYDHSLCGEGNDFDKNNFYEFETPNLSGKVRYSPNYIFKNYQPESNKCLLIINQKNLRHICKLIPLHLLKYQ